MKNKKLKQIVEYIENADFFDFVEKHKECPVNTQVHIAKIKKEVKKYSEIYKEQTITSKHTEQTNTFIKSML